MMHMRLWAAEGIFGSIVALILTYYILEPGNFAFRYADVLGWSAVVAFLLLVIQGFWSRRRHMSLNAEPRRVHVSYRLALFEWGGMHTAMSIVVTVFFIVHGFLLLPGLWEPSLALWLGASAFFILLLVNFSGLLTESARKSRRFSLLKRWHYWLMFIVLVLVVLHVEGTVTILSPRLILSGTIVGLAAVLFVWIIIPLTLQFAQHT